jgi:hypothetical protein
MAEAFQEPLRACGWWTLTRQKIVTSPADYWIFVLVANRTRDFIIIKPTELLKRLDAIHGKTNKFQNYFWITKNRTCWETRGLRNSDQLRIAAGQFRNEERDFTEYLDNWEPIEELNC